jgi:hypothetical protein
VCTASYAYTGSAQTFTVPANISSATFSVQGAQGGFTRFTSVPGGGGSVTGTLAVTAAATFTLVVGQAGATGGDVTYGGGGATGLGGYLGSGGGGSFVFDSTGQLLIAAGGGGGAGVDGRACGQSFLQAGGPGGGAGMVGGDGQGGCYPGETVATGGGLSSVGVAGHGRFGNGADGAGPASNSLPGAGGDGGGPSATDVYRGGGGGGGYYGGGGGAYAQSGAGGSGYVTNAATDVASTSGTHTGDGTIEVSWSQLPTTVVLSTASTGYGQAVHAHATVTSSSGSAPGSVQFSVDGSAVGSPVSVTATTVGAVATSPDLTDSGGNPLARGSHSVLAQFTPDDAVTYAGSEDTSSQLIGRAASTTTVGVGANSLTATVAAVVPSAGTPTGNVRFSVAGHLVGTAALSSGVATLSYHLPTGAPKTVAAAYAGNTLFTGSSASTARVDPSITATLTSARPRTRAGWYRTAVTVSFHCVTHGAALSSPCPAAVRLARNGGDQSVTRTVTATNGGAGTVVVRGVNIDHTAPRVRVSGVRDRAFYRGIAPTARCVGRDALSGIARCALTRHTSDGLTRYTARATDRAGNTATASGWYRTLGAYLQGAAVRDGAFVVHTGRTYELVVHSTRRPRYYDAERFPQIPTRADLAFFPAGHDRWTLLVTMSADLAAHRYWNLGVKVGRTMHTVKIRVA